MKKTFVSFILMLAVVTGASAQSWKDLLGKVAGEVVNEVASNEAGSAVTDILGTLLGNSMTLSPAALDGTWSYEGVACILESENALSNIGGTLVTGQIEAKLDEMLGKVGVKAGNCSFVFTEEGECSIKIGNYDLKGTYELDSEEKVINFSFLYDNVHIKTYIAYELQKLNVVFRADKLLAFVKSVTSFLSKDASTQQLQQLTAVTQAASSIGVLLNSYDGMMLGARLKRETAVKSVSSASNSNAVVKEGGSTVNNTAANAVGSLLSGLATGTSQSSDNASAVSNASTESATNLLGGLLGSLVNRASSINNNVTNAGNTLTSTSKENVAPTVESVGSSVANSLFKSLLK